MSPEDSLTGTATTVSLRLSFFPQFLPPLVLCPLFVTAKNAAALLVCAVGCIPCFSARQVRNNLKLVHEPVYRRGLNSCACLMVYLIRFDRV